MVRFKGFWHGMSAATLAVALGVLHFACGGGGGSESTVTVTGKVTYTRRSLVKDGNGVPTGLNTSYDAAQIARGIKVRAIKAKTEKVDGVSTLVYKTVSTTFTSSEGKFTLSIPKDAECFVEIQSVAGTSSTQPIRLVADEDTDLADIASGTPTEDCKIYALRKALNGNSDTSNPVLTSKLSADATINFAIDASTQWWIAPATLSQVEDATLEDSPTGSRIPAIADSIYTFMNAFGDPTPGASLDLFYRPGMADDPRGSFVDCSDSSRYYGSLRATGNDDAWDESIIFMLCGRNALQSHTSVSPYTFPASQLPIASSTLVAHTGLHPVQALIDGLPYAMAASLLRSPYLADTQGSALADLRDIREITGLETGAHSAPGIAALGWDLLLKANGLSAASAPSTWSDIKTKTLRKLFALEIPVDTNSRPVDTASIYKQLLRLQETKTDNDPIDLEAIFTDAVLTDMVAPYGLEWPRPASGSGSTFLKDLGTDPEGDFPIVMDMASAHALPDGTFPNRSLGEINYAKFLLSKDTLYELSATVSPALPDGASLEIKIKDASGQLLTTTLRNGGGLVSDSLMLDGNATTYTYIPVYLRLKTGDLTTPLASRTVTLSLVRRAS